MLVNRMFSILYEKAWQLLPKLLMEEASSFTSLKSTICIDLIKDTSEVEIVHDHHISYVVSDFFGNVY